MYVEQKSIDTLPTKEIHEQSSNLKGLSEITILPYEKFSIVQGQRVHEFTGPARLLINKD